MADMPAASSTWTGYWYDPDSSEIKLWKAPPTDPNRQPDSSLWMPVPGSTTGTGGTGAGTGTGGTGAGTGGTTGTGGTGTGGTGTGGTTGGTGTGGTGTGGTGGNFNFTFGGLPNTQRPFTPSNPFNALAQGLLGSTGGTKGGTVASINPNNISRLAIPGLPVFDGGQPGNITPIFGRPIPQVNARGVNSPQVQNAFKGFGAGTPRIYPSLLGKPRG